MPCFAPLVERSALCNARFLRRTFFCVARQCSGAPRSATEKSAFRQRLDAGPGLEHFMGARPASAAGFSLPAAAAPPPPALHPYAPTTSTGASRPQRFFVETYGCQMNVADSEIVASVLSQSNLEPVTSADDADIVFLNTCSIRENAEQKIWQRLNVLKKKKLERSRKLARAARGGETPDEYPMTVGVLGCMAERLKQRLLDADKLVDIVAGPDAYRDLPRLLARVRDEHSTAINVVLSQDETYADITPLRLDTARKQAYVTIMRGCNNMCSYCIVPFTRGRERSRPLESIVDEVRLLSDEGVKEVTLLGQNVNSYNDTSQGVGSGAVSLSNEGFRTVYRSPRKGRVFADLLQAVSRVDPEMRVRFTSPHPKDFPRELLDLIADRPNICKSLHIPAQSGSSAVLERMLRGYTRETYLSLAEEARDRIPGVALSTDMISGFCGETEQDHQDTLSLMREVKFEHAFMFAYSEREKTRAHRRFPDDVPEAVKQQRLREVIDTYHENLAERNKAESGAVHCVLVEGKSRRSESELVGRSDTNRKIVFAGSALKALDDPTEESRVPSVGEYVAVRIGADPSGVTLRGAPIARCSLASFERTSAR